MAGGEWVAALRDCICALDKPAAAADEGDGVCGSGCSEPVGVGGRFRLLAAKMPKPPKGSRPGGVPPDSPFLNDPRGDCSSMSAGLDRSRDAENPIESEAGAATMPAEDWDMRASRAANLSSEL